MLRAEDGRSERGSLIFPENVPHGGALCLLSCCYRSGICRLSLQNGTLIGGEKIGGESFSAVQILENEIVGVANRTPTVHNVMSGRKIAALVGGHIAALLAVTFLPRSQLLVTGGMDKEVVVWNRLQPLGASANGESGVKGEEGDPPFAVKCPLQGHLGSIRILDAWEEPNNIVVSGSSDDTARVWDVVREECVSVLQGHRNTVWGLCHDSERQIQFSGSGDETVIAWDFRLSQHQKIVEINVGIPNHVSTLCYRPKHSQLVVACYGGPLQVIDIRMLRSDNPTTSVVHEWDSGHTGSVFGSCDVPDDNWDYFVTSGYTDKHVKAWKENGKCVWDWKAPSLANPCGILPFIRGDPCAVLELIDSDEFHGEKCQFLTKIGAFSMRIQLVTVSSTGEMGFWKWVMLIL